VKQHKVMYSTVTNAVSSISVHILTNQVKMNGQSDGLMDACTMFSSNRYIQLLAYWEPKSM